MCYLEDSIEIESGILEVVNEFGINYACLGDYKKAIEYFRKAFEVSKDVSAGAVLVFTIFAVLCGVSILWQPEAFEMLFNHYAQNPVYIVWFVLSVVIFTLFIFKFDFSKKKKGKD